MFEGCDFLNELTQHIPPKGIQYIRRYGLYASRTRGKWSEHPEIVRHAPAKWKAAHQEIPSDEEILEEDSCEIPKKHQEEPGHGYLQRYMRLIRSCVRNAVRK